MRKTPYTEIWIKRLKRYRCWSPAQQQRQICSDSNIYRPICNKCDYELNVLVLDFMGFKDKKNKLKKYKKFLSLS
jgi:hypothetical protein